MGSVRAEEIFSIHLRECRAWLASPDNQVLYRENLSALASSLKERDSTSITGLKNRLASVGLYRCLSGIDQILSGETHEGEQGLLVGAAYRIWSWKADLAKALQRGSGNNLSLVSRSTLAMAFSIYLGQESQAKWFYTGISRLLDRDSATAELLTPSRFFERSMFQVAIELWDSRANTWASGCVGPYRPFLEKDPSASVEELLDYHASQSVDDPERQPPSFADPPFHMVPIETDLFVHLGALNKESLASCHHPFLQLRWPSWSSQRWPEDDLLEDFMLLYYEAFDA